MLSFTVDICILNMCSMGNIRLNMMSSLFSFGVLLLEIISGQLITCFPKEENDVDLLHYVSMNLLVTN